MQRQAWLRVGIRFFSTRKGQQGATELIGRVQSIVWQSQEVGKDWKKAHVVDSSTSQVVNVVGVMPGLKAGESTYEFTGHWTTHDKYGDQFNVTDFIPQMSETLSGLKSLLRDILKLKVLADRIVEKFGTETMDVLSSEQAFSRLLTVEGIGESTAKQILAVFASSDYHKTMRFALAKRAVRDLLASFDVSEKNFEDIVEWFDKQTPSLVSDPKALCKEIMSNPYKLCFHIKRFSFKTSDDIALTIGGLSRESPIRVAAAASFVVQGRVEKGDTAVPEPSLLRKTMDLLETEEKNKIEAILQSHYLRTQEGADKLEFRWHGGELFAQLSVLARAEEDIATFVSRDDTSELPNVDETFLEQAEKDMASDSFKFTSSQIDAIDSVTKNRVTVITGGPGSGKSMIVPSLLSLLRGKAVAIVAPTGRAADKLRQVIDETDVENTDLDDYFQELLDEDENPASERCDEDMWEKCAEKGGVSGPKTIHRLVHSFGEHFESPFDCVIVDEASMLDIPLAARLVRILKPDCKLVLIGDADQLPSVGPGNLLHDLIRSKKVCVSRLEGSKRQKDGSSLIDFALAFNRGDVYLSREALRSNTSDFSPALTVQFVCTQQGIGSSRSEECADIVIETFRNVRESLSSMDDVQILVPKKQGSAGINAINEKFQDEMNPNKKVTGVDFKVGDKVMQTSNDYDKGLYNGAVGIVDAIAKTDEATKLTAIFSGQRYIFTSKEAHNNLELAYAISVHKSQGSEYPIVIVVVSNSHQYMLTRRLLYTAVTRAKEKVILIGDPEAYRYAAQNTYENQRCTLLLSRLAEVNCEE